MYYVFFDVDGTLVKKKTALCFLKYLYKKRYGVFGDLCYCWFFICHRFYEIMGLSREELNKKYYKKYEGISESDIVKIADEWFQSTLSDDFYIEPVINELKYHKKAGADIVFVSGSFAACLAPIASNLQVQHVISTKQEVINGKLTGKILSPQVIGVGKAKAVKQFLEERQEYSLQRHFAYGDHISDLPMLNAVGNPCVVSGDLQLEKVALQNSWRIIKLDGEC